MATTVEQLVETHLKVIDKATGPLQKVADAADKANQKLEKVGKTGSAAGRDSAGWFGKLEGTFNALLPVAGALGAALGLKSVIGTTEQYLKRIKEVKDLTGATAGETDFLFSSARKAGVEYDQMQRVMFQLSRRGSMLEQTMAAATNKVPGMAEKFKRMGVVMDKGPVEAVASMATAVKKGKLDAGDLMSQFRVPPGQVNDFKEFLGQLDETKLRAAKAGGMGLVSDADVESFDRLEKAQHRISDAWNRIQVMVGKRLIPVMADLVEKVADKMENSWLPAAEKFGAVLSRNMGLIVGAAKSFVAIMTAKKLLNVLASITSPTGLLGKLAIGGMGGLAKGGIGGAGAILGQLGGIISGFAAALPILAAIGAAVGVIYLGYQAITSNVDGVRDRLVAIWDTIRARFELIGESLGSLWEKVAGIFGGDGTFTEFIGKIAALGFEKIAQGFDFFVHVIQTAIGFLGELGDMLGYLWREYLAEPARKVFGGIRDGVLEVLRAIKSFLGPLGEKLMGGLGDVSLKGTLLETPAAMWQKHWDAAEKLSKQRALKFADERRADAATRRDPSSARPPAPNFDFRNSRFDITQNFAEGFDPDRVAVGFANDLASLGEMRTQSGLAPAFAIR